MKVDDIIAPLQSYKTILLVDDDDDIIGLFSGIANRYPDIKLEYAKDGGEAFVMMQDFTPDLILSDIMMPGMNGLELFVLVKNIPEFAGIPFVFLSANDDDEDVLASFGFGANDYIVKPFHYRDVFERVYHIAVNKGAAETRKYELHSNIRDNNVRKVLSLVADTMQYKRRVIKELRQHVPVNSILIIEDRLHNPVGTIHMQDDRILNAFIDGNNGEAIFYTLANIDDGYIKYQVNPDSAGDIFPLINRPVSHLIS